MTSRIISRSLATLLAAGAVVGATLAVSACTTPATIGVGWSSDEATATTATTATTDVTTTVATPTTTATPTSTTDEPAVTLDTGPAWATDGTVALALTVHVEGHTDEARDEAEFDDHVASVEHLADLAEASGVILNLELASTFVDAVDQWHSTFIEDMVARGHSISQHSGDRSTSGLTGQARVDELVRQREAIEAHGVDVTYVSGGCSNDAGWVEAAVAAGFDAVTGTTEFCLGSLDDATLPEAMDWVRDCPDPSVCHDPLHLELDRLLHPWTTNSSETWIDDDPTGSLVILPGMESTGLADLSRTGHTDLDAAVDQWTWMLDDAIAGAVIGQVNVIDVVLSVGAQNSVDDEVLTAMFDVAAERVAAGTLTWVSLADVVSAAVAEAPTQPADAPAVMTDTTPDLTGGRSGRPTGAALPPTT
ncbi:MAG: hypothetical protein U0Q22_19770, partial [Acidimicrobiales bacterium]